VASLPDLVQRANDFRAITGGGLAFLKIPRTYYGLLTEAALRAGAAAEAGEAAAAAAGPGPGLTPGQAKGVVAALVAAGLVDDVGAVRRLQGRGGRMYSECVCVAFMLA
jgi:hypothetical protein